MAINSSIFLCFVCLWRTRSILLPEQRFGCTSIELPLSFLFVSLKIPVFYFELKFKQVEYNTWNALKFHLFINKTVECFKRWQIQNSSFSALLVSYLHFIPQVSMSVCVYVCRWFRWMLFYFASHSKFADGNIFQLNARLFSIFFATDTHKELDRDRMSLIFFICFWCVFLLLLFQFSSQFLRIFFLASFCLLCWPVFIRSYFFFMSH